MFTSNTEADHNHFVKKSELTAKQLEEAKEFLAKKAENTITIDKSELDSKKNYIALFYCLQLLHQYYHLL